MIWNIKPFDSPMYLKEKNGIPFFVFRNLEDTGLVRQAFSTRLGGVSKDHLSSMNLSFTRGDEERYVRENFQRLANAAGFATQDLVLSDQTHTANVRLVGETDRGKGFDRPRDYQDVDGLITDTPGLILATFYADCVPLYFVDPVRRAIGLSHAGWRGTVKQIGAVTLQKMREAFGTDPGTVQAAIGPSICQDCYEVGGEVALEFCRVFGERVDRTLLYKTENGKYHLNLWRANELTLLEAGIRPENLAVTNICTCCNSKLLFSQRGSRGRRGNLGAFLGLKENDLLS